MDYLQIAGVVLIVLSAGFVPVLWFLYESARLTRAANEWGAASDTARRWFAIGYVDERNGKYKERAPCAWSEDLSNDDYVNLCAYNSGVIAARSR